MGSDVRLKVVPVLILVPILLFALASSAFAEGYNQGTLINPDDRGWGGLSEDVRFNYTGLSVERPGPHGDYNATTNKCQDCHSTHYAVGSYMLLRADSREAACDFCHGGGGGAGTIIMMDNAYTKSAAELALTGGPSADSTTTAGFGTGHTLGYVGKAPVGIKPAFETNGFSCFDCHTPHGNSARVLPTFHSPGRAVVPTRLDYTVHLQFPFAPTPLGEAEGYEFGLDPIRVYVQYHDEALLMEDVPLVPPDLAAEPPYFDSGNNGWHMAWGIEGSQGNYVIKYDFSVLGFGTEDWHVVRKPIFPSGKFLLLKNPHNQDGLGMAGDLATATTDLDGVDVVTDGNNKIAIDWVNPLGPAATVMPTHGDFEFGTSMFYTGNDERFPYPFFINEYGEDRPGIATVGEFCTDCHGGAAGMSTQAAEVWFPAADDYVIAYSHDSQPRSCDRQMYLNAGDDNNFGPECRSCHSGAGSCAQCHADPSLGGVEIPLESAWDADGVALNTEGVTSFAAQPSLRNFGAYNPIGSVCVDGGFSFPHRTLAANMLKDSLWGVDFDGTPLAPGAIRGAGMDPSDVPGGLDSAWSFRPADLVGVETHNLDSACLDCHNPTIWNGDDSAYKVSITATNWFKVFDYRAEGAADGWSIEGWELLLKGLP